MMEWCDILYAITIQKKEKWRISFELVALGITQLCLMRMFANQVISEGINKSFELFACTWAPKKPKIYLLIDYGQLKNTLGWTVIGILHKKHWFEMLSLMLYYLCPIILRDLLLAISPDGTIESFSTQTDIQKYS